MGSSDGIVELIQYDLWCTDQIAEKMEALGTDDLCREFLIGWRTLHRTLFHIVTAAELWSDRSRAEPSGVRPDEENPGPGAATVKSLRERYAVAGEQMLASLKDLQATAATGSREASWRIRRNHLIHITTHSMHHRAQMIFMLTQIGVRDVIEGGDFGGWANGPIKKEVGREGVKRWLY